MPIIGARVSAETKVEFESLAHDRDTTSSRLAALLLTDFVKHEKAASTEAIPPQRLWPAAARAGRTAEARTEQVFVRLEPYYFAELGRLASARQWYRGTYLSNLFRAHLDRRPVLCDVEIQAVRQIARQLADMGRNINQIARKLNTSLETAHLVTSLDFELVKMLIELETNAVKDLIKANVRGWGVNDGEA